MSAKCNRRRLTAPFKAEVALAVKFGLTPAQITTWKPQVKQQAAHVFTGPAATAEPALDVEALYAQLGRLQMENALLKKTRVR